MSIEKSINDIIEFIGDDISRIEKTPSRVIDGYNEIFNGYKSDITKLFQVTYPCDIQDMVILKNIPFSSVCEHHMLQITGIATVGYISDKCVIGASKIARIVDAFANRLQLQERLTVQIAQSLYTGFPNSGVAVYINAQHSCISLRGVKKQGSSLVTRHFTGKFVTEKSLRDEFLLEIQ